MKNLLENLILTHSRGVGPVAIRDLLEAFGTAEKVVNAGEKELLRRGVRPRLIEAITNPQSRQRAEETLLNCQTNNVRILIKGQSERYPKLLLECHDSPHVLYQYGDLDLNEHRLVSIVGTRRGTLQGKESTQEIVQELARAYKDIVIVSGLALGIDKEAHMAALRCGVPTVAVLPGWVLDIAPKQHVELARTIIRSGGALLSDMPPGTVIGAANFLSRNRIVAGLSHATIVVESPKKGGSISTATIAGSYSRAVFALPGRSCDHNYFGTNLLIKSNRAILYQDLGDLAVELSWPRPGRGEVQAQELSELTGLPRDIYDAMPENEPVTLDAICELLELTVSQCSIALITLESGGFIRSIPGGLYLRSIY